MSPSGSTTSASARSLVAASQAPCKSGGPRTSRDWSCNPSVLAAACVSCQSNTLTGFAAFQRTATRVRVGTASLSNSSRFGANSGGQEAQPGDITTGPREALHETRLDRIAADTHDDGNGAGGLLGG